MPSGRVSKTLLLAGLAALALAGGGCRKRSAQAAPPLVIVATPSETTTTAPRPTPSQPDTKPAEVQPSAPAPKPPELVVPAAKKNSRSTAPTAKSAPPEEPPATETAAPRPAPPKMSPRLSAKEQADYQRKTNTAISVAEKNLQLANGKALNAAQADLVEKIRGFLAQAREAAVAGDWQRAHNLAQKAQVLSVELVNSL